MNSVPLFDSRVRVRIHAPTSRFDGHEGTVGAHELRAVHASHASKHPAILTIHLDEPGASTLAYADELEVLSTTPPGGQCR